MENWRSYYRTNPDRFMEDFYGIKLRPYQRVLIKMLVQFDKKGYNKR